MAGGILSAPASFGKTTLSRTYSFATVKDLIIAQSLYNDRSTQRANLVKMGDNCDFSTFEANILVDLSKPLTRLKKFDMSDVSATQVRTDDDEGMLTTVTDMAVRMAAIRATRNIILNNTGYATPHAQKREIKQLKKEREELHAQYLKDRLTTFDKEARQQLKSDFKAQDLIIANAINAAASKIPNIWVRIGATLAGAFFLDKIEELNDDKESTDFDNNDDKDNGSFFWLVNRDGILKASKLYMKDFQFKKVLYNGENFYVINSNDGYSKLILYKDITCGVLLIEGDGGFSDVHAEPFITTKGITDIISAGMVKFEGKPHILSGEHGAPLVMETYSEGFEYSADQKESLSELLSDLRISYSSLMSCLRVIDSCWYDSANSDALSYAGSTALKSGLPAAFLKIFNRYCATKSIILFTASPTGYLPLTAEAIQPSASGSVFTMGDGGTYVRGTLGLQLHTQRDGDDKRHKLGKCLFLASTIKDNYRNRVCIIACGDYLMLPNGKFYNVRKQTMGGTADEFIALINAFNKLPFTLFYNKIRDVVEVLDPRTNKPLTIDDLLNDFRFSFTADPLLLKHFGCISDNIDAFIKSQDSGGLYNE